eukprot:6478317-Amphidinium_carterae.1
MQYTIPSIFKRSLEPTAIQSWIGGTLLTVKLKDLLGGKEMHTVLKESALGSAEQRSAMHINAYVLSNDNHEDDVLKLAKVA